MQDEQTRGYQNHVLVPLQLAKDLVASVLSRGHWTVEQRLATMDKVTRDLVMEVPKQVFSRCHADVLVHGNLTAEAATALQGQVTDTLGNRGLGREEHPVGSTWRIEEGVWTLRRDNSNPEDDNTVVDAFFQLDGRQARQPSLFVSCGNDAPDTCCGMFAVPDIRTTALCRLASSIMAEPLFQELRTKQQLGYSVSCDTPRFNNHEGFLVRVECQASGRVDASFRAVGSGSRHRRPSAVPRLG